MSKTLIERMRPAAPPQVDTRPTLLFFFRRTSGASRRVDRFLAQVLQRLANHSTFRVVRADADERRDLVEPLRISEIPTILVVAEGRVRGRINGRRDAARSRDCSRHG
jgi:thioredoxin-like negative regulator of GroEL